MLSTLPGKSPQGTPSSLVCGTPFLSRFEGRPAGLVPCVSGLNFGVFHLGPFLCLLWLLFCSACARWWCTSRRRFIAPLVLRKVLPELAKSLDLLNVRGIQFMPNGVVRVTYKEPAQCDAALACGIRFCGAQLRITSVDSRTRLVYVRDLRVEVPDDGLKVFLRAFPVVHSCAMQTYSGMPDVFSGTRVVKVTLAKDLPSAARVSGFDVWLWYQGQPQVCPVCRSYRHRVKDCPFNGCVVAAASQGTWLVSASSAVRPLLLLLSLFLILLPALTPLFPRMRMTRTVFFLCIRDWFLLR